MGVNIHWNAQGRLIYFLTKNGVFLCWFKLLHIYITEVYKCTIVQSKVCSTTRVHYRYRLDIKTRKYYKFFYICKVYTKYTLYIYRSKTKVELDFFFYMLNNDKKIASVWTEETGVGSKHTLLSTLKTFLGVQYLSSDI